LLLVPGGASSLQNGVAAEYHNFLSKRLMTEALLNLGTIGTVGTIGTKRFQLFQPFQSFQTFKFSTIHSFT
jgi:hypothetical protein